MKNTIYFFLVLFFSFFSCTKNERKLEEKAKYKVGLCVVATGKYDTFAYELIESAQQFFLKDQHVTYFVFTDGKIPEGKNIIRIDQKRLGWPYDSLKRFHIYSANRARLKEMDYLFAIDADMKFVASVGDEILGDLVATRHFGFLNKKGTYEKNRLSKAYVKSKEGKTYFAGAFYGGKREKFFSLLDTVIGQIDADLKKDYIAVWHDESHLNRYFIDHPPDIVLSPSYCYPSHYGNDFPYEKKILAIYKPDLNAVRK